MNNYINLTNEICSRFKNIGFKNDLNREEIYMIKYFLTTLLDSLISLYWPSK